ncbi:MAG: PTS sugar transporter subunit IIA [Chthoniobacterales bacterium]
MNVEEKDSLLSPSCVLLNLKGSHFTECLQEFLPLVKASASVIEADKFLQDVQEREHSSSTNTGRGIAFPHARTHAVGKIFVAIGRSIQGISLQSDTPPVHLLFLIGTPPGEIATYLDCMSWLAASVRNVNVYTALLEAQTPEDFITIMQGDR